MVRQATERLRNQARANEMTQRLITARSSCPSPKEVGTQREATVFQVQDPGSPRTGNMLSVGVSPLVMPCRKGEGVI